MVMTYAYHAPRKGPPMRLRLREVREAKFITQRELAARTGLTPETISRLERGTNPPLITTVRRLAEALGVEPQELIAEPDNDEPGKHAA